MFEKSNSANETGFWDYCSVSRFNPKSHWGGFKKRGIFQIHMGEMKLTGCTIKPRGEGGGRTAPFHINESGGIAS